jgi:uncharacterized protein with PQ loop repeat
MKSRIQNLEEYKMNSSKAAIVISVIIEKVQLIVGIFITFVFGFATIGSIWEDKTDGGTTFVMFILATIGVLLIIFSRKRKKLIKDFKTYVQRLSVDPAGSIEDLASGVGTSQDVVKMNIEKMIRKRYFANAYIDIENNRVVFPTVSEQNQTNEHKAIKIDYITATCKSCGGINKLVKGTVYECDYCGSPIS